MGLSASPVLTTVISSIVVVVGAAAAAMAGIRFRDVSILKLDCWPLAVFMVALVGGSAAGVVARTRDVLAPSPSTVLAKWEQLGVKKEVVVERLLAASYPETAGSVVTTEPQTANTFAKTDPRTGVLFADSAEGGNCSLLKALDGEALRRELLASNVRGVSAFAKRVTDTSALRAAVDLLICP
jgi:hypothetical protein